MRPRTVHSALVVQMFLGVAGCASTPVGPGPIAGVAPILSVERFLQAANMRDLEAMARIFGTAEGAIADRSSNAFVCAFKRMGSWIGLGEGCLSRSEIELRMNAIAVILEHDDFAVRTESAVPGRSRPTTRVSVDLTRGPDQFQDVPFVVVQTADGRWLVEEIGLELMTAGRILDLDEFPEDSAGALRMHEGYEVPSSARTGLFIDEPNTGHPHFGKVRTEIGYTKGNVMQTGSAPSKEASDRTVRVGRLEKLDRTHKGHVHAVVR